MSLYIGKDNDNNNTIIISRVEKNSEELKSSTVYSPDIVFSSKFNYATVAYQSFTNIPVDLVSGKGTVTLNAGISEAYLANRTPIFFIDGVQVPLITDTFPTYLARYWVIPPTFSGGIGTLIIHTPNNNTVISKLEVLILPFKNDFTNINLGLYGGSVDISNKNFLVNSTDIFRTQFIVSGSLNNVDSSISFLGNTYQIINSVYSSGPVSISSNNNITSISVGSKIVLSSTASYVPLVENSFSTTYTNYISNFYMMGYPGETDRILAVPNTVETNAVYLMRVKIWSNYNTESNFAPPFLIKVGAAGSFLASYTFLPGEVYPEPLWFYEIRFTLHSDGYLSYDTPLAQAGHVRPIENVYYGPYNVRIESRRVA